MSKLVSLLTVGLALSLGAVAHAADEKSGLTKQQSKMSICNMEAGDKKGDERKAFMSECLKDKPLTQQDKMKACNADEKAKTLKGDDRKAFMSECLKK
ncbi:MAG: PsiF family protein [Acidovorax sp.]|jgi:hypothetical protein